MRKAKKILAFLLAALMIVSALTLASCADSPAQNPNKPTPGEDESGNNGDDDKNEIERLPLNLPDTTYGGNEVHFLSWSAGNQTTAGQSWIPWEEIDVDMYDGDTINSAIYDRNGTVEEKFDVVISNEYLCVDQGYSSAVRTNHSSGEDAYQVITQRSYGIKALVLEGLMYNMYELSNIHTSMPWWNQDSVRSFTLGTTLYFAAPEMLLRDKGATAAMYYNATVATDKGVTGLYEMVKDGEWTMEEFVSISEEAATDMDGNDLMDSASDLWGAAVTDDTVFFLFAGANMKFAHIDDDGYINYDFGSDDSILYMQDIFDDVIYTDYCAHPSVHKLSMNAKKIFMNDNALFTFDMVKNVATLRNMESDFGVLPIPKYDSAQENYASLVWVHHDCVLGMPSVVADPEMVSVVLEYMSYLSYYDVYPVFYDTVIMGKSTRDEQSKEMLKIIFETRLFDPGQYWDNGEGATGIQEAYLRLAATGKKDIASIYATYATPIQNSFDKLNALIDDMM